MACHVAMPVLMVHKPYPGNPRSSFYNMAEVRYKQLVSLPNAKNKAWKYFGFPGDSKGKIIDKKVYCKLCNPPWRPRTPPTCPTLHTTF